MIIKSFFNSLSICEDCWPTYFNVIWVGGLVFKPTDSNCWISSIGSTWCIEPTFVGSDRYIKVLLILLPIIYHFGRIVFPTNCQTLTRYRSGKVTCLNSATLSCWISSVGFLMRLKPIFEVIIIMYKRYVGLFLNDLSFWDNWGPTHSNLVFEQHVLYLNPRNLKLLNLSVGPMSIKPILIKILLANLLSA